MMMELGNERVNAVVLGQEENLKKSQSIGENSSREDREMYIREKYSPSTAKPSISLYLMDVETASCLAFISSYSLIACVENHCFHSREYSH